MRRGYCNSCGKVTDGECWCPSCHENVVAAIIERQLIQVGGASCTDEDESRLSREQFSLLYNEEGPCIQISFRRKRPSYRATADSDNFNAARVLENALEAL